MSPARRTAMPISAWDRKLLEEAYHDLSIVNRQLQNGKTTASYSDLEALQSSHRHRINELSRPYLSSITILDLPDEVLLGIFETAEVFEMEYPFFDTPDLGSQVIKNTRCVCRRFRDVSSELLIRTVRVTFNEASLARLDEISRHPTISKGVHHVQVVVQYYNRALAPFPRHLSYLEKRLREDVASARSFKPEELEIIARGEGALSILRRLVASADLADGYLTDEEKDHRMQLQELHRRYLACIEEQDALLRSGKFYQVTASALGRMPRARGVTFTDEPSELSRQQKTLHIKSGSDVWPELHRVMRQPALDFNVLGGLELPDYRCIARLIDSLRQAGTFLKRLRIDVRLPGARGTLWPAPDIRQHFSSCVQQLEHFTVVHFWGLVPQHTDEMTELLSACLDTPSLQRVELYMLTKASVANPDVGNVLGPRMRPNLTDLSFREVSMHLRTLASILDSLSKPVTRLVLLHVRLLSGTWREALDMIRRKAPARIVINTPSGAECDHMSREDANRIFYKGGMDHPNEAELYIMKQLPVNPLLPASQ